MHSRKLLAVVFLTAACAGSVEAQRPDNEAQIKARDALRQALAAPATTATPAKPAEATTAPAEAAPAKPAATAPATPPPVAAATAAPAAAATGKTLTPEQEAQARNALNQPMQNMGTPQPGAMATTPTPAPKPTPPPAAVPAAAATAPPAMAAAPAPAAAAGSKEQRLRDLLDQYMADKISPAEYHAQRAKILAGK